MVDMPLSQSKPEMFLIFVILCSSFFFKINRTFSQERMNIARFLHLAIFILYYKKRHFLFILEYLLDELWTHSIPIVQAVHDDIDASI